MSIIDMYEASVILGLPEFLIRDFVKCEFNQRRLKALNTDSGAYQFLINEVQDFYQHLETSWGGNGRIGIPEPIKRYLKYEAQGVCAICQMQKPHYEYAHIQPWAKSRCHSPHNILYLCLDCHRSYGNDIKLLKAVKEERLRRIKLLDSDFIYDCAENMVSGQAAYILNGTAHLAVAKDLKKTATCFIKTKIGNNRCTVQRYGVVIVNDLQPGEKYFLSASIPGDIVTYEELEATRDQTIEYGMQLVGRAESNKHLAIALKDDAIWVPLSA